LIPNNLVENSFKRSDPLTLLPRPGGKPVLSMNDNAAVERELLHYLNTLKMVA